MPVRTGRKARRGSDGLTAPDHRRLFAVDRFGRHDDNVAVRPARLAAARAADRGRAGHLHASHARRRQECEFSRPAHPHHGGRPRGPSPPRGEKANLPAQRIRITEGAIEALPPDWASALRGSRSELVLRPSRFLFRPLELPKRATEYLEGIVRAQIDRLTPWARDGAVYSWTAPIDATNDRIHLTIAATARSMVAPYLEAMEALGAS